MPTTGINYSAQDQENQSTTKEPQSRTLYVCDIDRGKCITHDGYIQIGIHSHTSDRHIELCNEMADRNGMPRYNWLVVHWIPDIFKHRYKRVTFQKTEKCNEGSPKTDNDGGILDKPQGCSKLEDK